MFDIGFWEILLISVLALLVVGPERLPKAARTAGLWFGRARRYIEGVKEEVASEFDVNELKRMVHNQEVMINDMQSKLNETVSLDDDDKDHEPEEEVSRQYDILEEGEAERNEAEKLKSTDAENGSGPEQDQASAAGSREDRDSRGG